MKDIYIATQKKYDMFTADEFVISGKKPKSDRDSRAYSFEKGF